VKNNLTPEIRFPGFTEEWEDRKLGEGTLKIGDGLHGTPHYSANGNTAFINGNNLVNGKIMINSQTKYVTSDQQSKDDKELNQNTILMSINGTIGNLAWYNGEKVMLGKSAAYIEVSSFDKNFMYQILQTSKIKSHFLSSLTGTTIKNLGLKTIRETPTLVPTLDEQKRIGQFFKKLDNTIDLHEQELTTLKQTKQGFLQKMFPKEGDSVPEVRFDGFGEDWEEQKLNYYLEVSNEKNYENKFSKKDVFSVSGEYGIVNQIDFQGRSFAGESVANYGIVKNGYVVYTKSPLKANPYGVIKTNKGKSGIVSTLYAVYKPKETLHPPIIEIMFENDSVINNYLRPLVNKGAKNDMKVRNEDVLKGKTRLPDIKEQQKISNFFKLLDDTIALHQRELDALKETKKAFLQKMFA
jgi:type I restriction enzyme, S subunit